MAETANPAALVLASGSPRRAELLALVSDDVTVDPAEVDESPVAGESPVDYVLRLATDKATAVARRHPERTVLGADTTVALDGRMLSKPVDASQAAAMLASLSGRSHEVFTGICVTGPGFRRSRVVRTVVTFRPLRSAEIDAYVASGEPFDKAGGYGIQGAAAAFVRHLDGSWTNVVGLPLAEVDELLGLSG